MTKRRICRHLAATTLAGAILVTGGPASATTMTYVDLEAGLGYSTNPLLQINGHSSVFGRLTASGFHSWTTERQDTSISGYVENDTYFRSYGSKQLFALNLHHRQVLSPTATVFGDVGFSGDFAGQLSNRLLSVPGQPVVIEPGNPLPPPTTTPDLFGFSGRSYRLNGQVGASIQAGPRGTVSLSAGAQHSWFTGPARADNYNTYFGSVGYSQQVSERTNVGATVYLQRQDYSHGDWANVINPVLTVHTQLSESVTADASAGVLAIEQRSAGGKDHSVSPSFSGSLCHNEANSRLCAHVERDANSSLNSRIGNNITHAAVSTTASVDYFRKLSALETLQASLAAVRYSAPSGLLGQSIRTTYLTAVVGYDRKVGHRLAAGVSGGARKLFQVGPDPKLDFNANVYVRYRLGELQ